MEEARRTTPTPFGRGLRKLASPNWPVVGILVALFVGLFVLSWLVARIESAPPNESLDAGFTALWQVQTGIAAIALPVLIFVIELSKDQEQAALRSPDVLIRSSAVLPISVFALLGVLRIGHDILWFETVSTFRVDFLLVLLPTVALAIYAYVSTLRLLFNASMFKSRAIDVAKEKMTNSLDASIEIRIANNILVQKLNEWGADLWILGEEKREGFIFISAVRRGHLWDVHLPRLEAFLRGLPKKPMTRAGAAFTGTDPVASSSKPAGPAQKHVWFTKRYREPIPADGQSLVRLETALFEGLDVDALQWELDGTVRIITRPRSDPNQELQTLLSFLKNNLIDAVRDGKSAPVRGALDVYEELIAAFIERLVGLGATDDRAKALDEMHSLGPGWSEVAWVENGLQEIMDAAFRSAILHVIEPVLYFPVRVSRLAFDSGDYYVFHRFLGWMEYAYQALVEMPAGRVRSVSVELCWRYVKEQADFVVAFRLKSAGSAEEVASKGDFAIGILSLMGNLLKAAYDGRDLGGLADFEQMASAVESMFDTYLQEDTTHELNRLKALLTLPSTSQEDRRRISARLPLLEAHTQLASRIRERRTLTFFGLGAWIFHHLLQDVLTSEEWNKWQDAIPYPETLEELWFTFLRARDFETEHEMSWHFWELRERKEGQAYAVEFGSYLVWLFVILALDRIGEREADSIAGILVNQEEVTQLAGADDSPFPLVLDKLTSDGKWREILGEETYGRIPLFHEGLSRAVRQRREQEEGHLREAELYEPQVKKVQGNILMEWRSAGIMRALSERATGYDFIDREPDPTIGFFGVNTTDPKELYVRQERLYAEDWGKDYGRSIARGEDERVLAELISASERTQADSEDEFLRLLQNAIPNANGGVGVIILLGSWFAYRAISGSDAFSQRTEEEDLPSVIGRFQELPVVRTWYHDEENSVLVVNLKKFAAWRQYRPRQVLTGETYISRELSFYAQPYDEERARELIARQPQLLRGQSGAEKDEEEVVLQLLKRVHLRVVEQFSYEVRVPEAAQRIIVPGYP